MITFIANKNPLAGTVLSLLPASSRLSQCCIARSANATQVGYFWLTAGCRLKGSEFATHNRTTIAKVISGEHKFRPAAPIKFGILNDGADHAEERLAKSFGGPIHLGVPRLSWLPHDPMVCTIHIKVVVFIFPTIISAQTSDCGISSLGTSLEAFESGKGLTFGLNDFDFRALCPIIKKGNEVFTPIAATRRNGAADVTVY